MRVFHTWLTGALVWVIVESGPTNSTIYQEQHEWISYGRLAQYAQDIVFSLVSFTVPPHTHRAEFLVTLTDGPTNHDKRAVLFGLRKAAIPVLQAFNQTVPESFILPSDQQIYETKNETNVTFTLNSPAPGRVYLVGTELNALSDYVDYIQWGQDMKGRTSMNVTATYTLRSSVMSLPVDDISKISSGEELTQVYSFRVPGFTMSFSIIINNCQHNSSSTNCPVTMVTADSLAMHDPSSLSVDCRQQGPRCQMTVLSPVLEQDHYVTFSFDNASKDQNITFDVTFDVQVCTVEVDSYTKQLGMLGNGASVKDLAEASNQDDEANATDEPELSSSPSSGWVGPVSPAAYRDLLSAPQDQPGSDLKPLCINAGYLGRNSYASKETSFAFKARFGEWTKEGEIIPHFDVVVPDFSTEVRKFSLQDSLDSGGVLHVMAELASKDWEGLVLVCAMPHRLPVNGSVDRCPDGALLMLNATATEGDNETHVFSQAYLPFPTSGTWYMAMQSQCRGSKVCEELPVIQLSVSLEECPPDNCGQYGDCQMYTDANLVFSGCSCHAGYRGLSCNDDSYSLSDYQQLRAVYLLTLSNLAFVPAICLAVYRCYFTLAAIFFFNAFFSAFYHACDASNVFQLCIMDYGTLAFCDFLGSVLSFYSILLQMARIPDSCRSFLLMVGVLVMAVTLNSDRHNDLAHVMPLVVAGGVLIISWARVMWTRKRLFPSRRRYLYYLLPGVVLAVLGISVNYGLMGNQSTYQYYHSFWHVSLMLTPCFLMPPRSRGAEGNKKGLSISAQDVIRSGQSEQLLHHQEEDEPAMFDASMNSINSGQNRLI